MGTNVAPAYRVLSEKEKNERGYGEYESLVGPDNFECFLGEPEDRSWYRDASAAVGRLNKQHAELLELRAEIARLTVGRVVVAEGVVEWDEQYSGNFKVTGSIETVAVAVVANEAQAEVVRNVGRRVRVVVEVIP